MRLTLVSSVSERAEKEVDFLSVALTSQFY